jgi:V8-like Glu-specific endopeptidase
MTTYEGAGRPQEASRPALNSGALKRFLAMSGVVACAAALMTDYPFRFFQEPVDKMPAALPGPVKQVKGSSLKVFVAMRNEAHLGSAVKISPHYAITAGHLFNTGRGQRSYACGSVMTENIYSKPNYEDTVTNWASNFVSRGSKDEDDVSLLKVSADKYFKKLPVAKIAMRTPSKGEPVFLLNYGYRPADDQSVGREHYPNEGLAKASKNIAAVGGMAMYGGVVVGKHGSMIEVAENLKAYGPKPFREVNSFHGSSGGGVYNAQGELIGVVDKTSSSMAMDVNDRNRVHLPVSQWKTITTSQVFPVTQELVASLKSEMTAPNCHWDN